MVNITGICTTAKKANLPTTFDEITCTALIGTQLDGDVKKVECDPYEYTIKETGEIMTMYHRYEYVNKPISCVPGSSNNHSVKETTRRDYAIT